MPTMKSTYAAAGIIAFMTSWNNFLWPLIILQSEAKKTITLVISSLSSAYFPEYGVIMVAIIIATLPTILIFFLLQRYFVEGMLGSNKIIANKSKREITGRYTVNLFTGIVT